MTAANVTDISANAPKSKPRKKATPAAEVARQAEAEAEDGFITIEQCGIELRLPLKGHIQLSIIELFRAGDNYGGTKAMIGPEQWQRLIEAGATDGDLDDIANKLNGASGN